ncbi:hypothetical protein PLESTB_001554400 [Pleodorina starrii]|uniref:Uncharacterized protein n=1 Tax=Pleodorina starrii TaxID=330485 RepID=A0A9W6F823_9CHLO|nr:hypothetical protein PLESTB_001554400 [Pleodorina starrii]GLC72851.1 hypothetical protein PLESTF_001299800 [Pleodorina starrii]
MQATFTPQEQQEIDRLREKYGGIKNDQAIVTVEGDASCVSCSIGSTPSTRQAEPSSTTGRPASNVEASICVYCHGTGTLVEIYNHRRLENFCKECDGRGVRVFKNGVEVQPGAAASNGGRGGPSTSSAAEGPAGLVALHRRKEAAAGGMGGPRGEGSSDEGEAVDERVAALQRDLQRITAKAALYAKERLDTLAILQRSQGISSGSSGGPASAEADGRERAARDLVAQLDLQLDRLELARVKKQTVLERLRGSAGDGGATLAGIIANEGGRS